VDGSILHANVLSSPEIWWTNVGDFLTPATSRSCLYICVPDTVTSKHILFRCTTTGSMPCAGLQSLFSNTSNVASRNQKREITMFKAIPMDALFDWSELNRRQKRCRSFFSCQVPLVHQSWRQASAHRGAPSCSWPQLMKAT
jgi:hypothetical protein